MCAKTEVRGQLVVHIQSDYCINTSVAATAASFKRPAPLIIANVCNCELIQKPGDECVRPCRFCLFFGSSPRICEYPYPTLT